MSLLVFVFLFSASSVHSTVYSKQYLFAPVSLLLAVFSKLIEQLLVFRC